MSGAAFRVTVDDAALQGALAEMLARVRHPRDAFAASGQALVTHVDLNFRAQADPWGDPWAELSPVTLSRRRGSSAQILRDTGRLANSLHARVNDTSVAVGTDVEYAAVHQYGHPLNRFFGRALAPIPARPFLPIRGGRVDLPDDLRADLLDILGHYLQAGSV
jgi:phage virion morphogenesis protein